MKTWWMRGLMANVKTLHLTNLFSLTWTHQPVLLICIYQLNFLLFLDVSILSQCLQAVSFRVKLAHWIEKAETSMMAKRIQHISEKKQYFIDCLHLTVMRINTEIIKIFLKWTQSTVLKNSIIELSFTCCIHVPDAQWGQTNGNIWVWSRERFIVGQSKEYWWLTLKRPKLPNGYQGRANLEQRAAECLTFLWLVGGEVTGWRSRISIISPLGPASAEFTYCVQSQVSILYLGGGLIPPEELRDLCEIVKCTSLEEELGLCLITALSSVQSLSRVRLFVTPWTAAH